MNEEPLVDVAGLRVSFGPPRAPVHAVRSASLTVHRGETVAIVGESGSGKSVTARSLLGLVGRGASVAADRLRVDGVDVLGLPERAWRGLRGRRVGYVLQDALVSLDPLRRVGAEIADALRAHRVVPAARTAERAVELLRSVGVGLPEARAAQYPHELSGGLRQRALIASAIAAEPVLLVADEPTTALDVTVQAQILRLLSERRRAGTAMLLISHDLAVVSEIADRVLVMKDGVFVEQGPVRRVLDQPRHAYTKRLLAAVPDVHVKRARLSPVVPSDVVDWHPVPDEVVLEADALVKRFPLPGQPPLVAVDDVSFRLHAGETLGLVGESGSGKSTVGRLLLGLSEPDSGTVRVLGRRWADLGARDRRTLRRSIQVIHQDPLSSFDPRYTAERIIAEPLVVLGMKSAERAVRVARLLDQVGLSQDVRRRRPRELSGGQRQRVAIARALAPQPKVIVCDEPVSALDVSIQAQVLDLLADLQRALGIALLFISHHLGVIRHMSDRVLVMKDGRIVEEGDSGRVFEKPCHPYTRELLESVPTLGSPVSPLHRVLLPRAVSRILPGDPVIPAARKGIGEIWDS
jgi:peptide/nickel transport system ATP-binding protein